MRTLAALLVLLLCTADAKPLKVGRCTGADHCPVCSDCSKCKWCDPKSPKGGSCGVLRDQDAAAAAKRQRKRR